MWFCNLKFSVTSFSFLHEIFGLWCFATKKKFSCLPHLNCLVLKKFKVKSPPNRKQFVKNTKHQNQNLSLPIGKFRCYISNYLHVQQKLLFDCRPLSQRMSLCRSYLQSVLYSFRTDSSVDFDLDVRLSDLYFSSFGLYYI